MQRRLQDTGFFERVVVSAALPGPGAPGPLPEEPERNRAPAEANAAASSSASATASATPAATASATVSANPAAQASDVPPAIPPTTITAPLTVHVVEFPAHRVTLGAGYSTNTGTRLQIGHGTLDPWHTGVRLAENLLLETRRQTARADVFFPPHGGEYRESIGARLRREDIAGELVRGASLTGTRAWGDELTPRNIALGLLVERRTVQDVLASSLHAAVASYGVTFRRVDNRLAPTRGHILELQAGVGLRLAGSRAPFSRGYGRVTGYRPVGEDNLLIMRLEGGVVGAGSRQGIPTEWLFRAGGDQSVRGYAYQSLGVEEGGAIVGGRVLATASTEWVHWLSRAHDWGVAGFIDAGSAADTFAALDPAVGYGLGVRWRSPVGPLSLDVAWGRRSRRWRIHLTLGATF